MLWLICDATGNQDCLSVEQAAAEEQVVLVEADTFEAAVAKLNSELGDELNQYTVLTKEQYENEEKEGDFYLIPVEPVR